MGTLEEVKKHVESPAGTAEHSPGRQSWVVEAFRSVPQGRLKIAQDVILGIAQLEGNARDWNLL
jgi:hypothetical protein